MRRRYDQDSQRRKLLLAILVIIFLGGLFFGLLNWIRGVWLAALIEFFFVMFCLVAFPLVRRTRHLRAWSLAIVLPWMAALLLILALPAAAVTVFVWALLLPMVLHFLLGRKLGLLLSLLGMGGALLLAWLRFGTPETAAELALVSNVVLAGVAILLLAHVYERGRENAEIELRRLAVTDPLTNLSNRSLLYEDFGHLKAQSLRHERPLSMLLLDLDRFKLINDRYGHDAGDQVLVAIADFLRRRLRQADHAYRIGGEEFLALLPDTNGAQALELAEALRERIEHLAIAYQDLSLSVTVSIGIAELGPDGLTLDDVLRQADQRLYWCKENGRNRVRGA